MDEATFWYLIWAAEGYCHFSIFTWVFLGTWWWLLPFSVPKHCFKVTKSQENRKKMDTKTCTQIYSADTFCNYFPLGEQCNARRVFLCHLKLSETQTRRLLHLPIFFRWSCNLMFHMWVECCGPVFCILYEHLELRVIV